jgi:hypothetical protein
MIIKIKSEESYQNEYLVKSQNFSKDGKYQKIFKPLIFIKIEPPIVNSYGIGLYPMYPIENFNKYTVLEM